MAGFLLGNLSLDDIEKRLKIQLTDEERDTLKPLRVARCDDVHNRYAWHCYDMPFGMACGNKAMVDLVLDILTPYSKDMAEPIRILCDYDEETEE